MRRSLLASVVLSLVVAGAARAQDPDECQRWSVEVSNSETIEISVYAFRGDRVPPRVFQRERSRLRGGFLKRINARGRETIELRPGLSIIWIEPVDAEHARQDLGWSEAAVIVASPTRRTRITNVRIRTEFTCLDDPR
jgi:hypothetical protein